MPLPSPELDYVDTWIYKFSTLSPDLHVINRCYRSSSATRLKGEGPGGGDVFDLFQPDFIITHLGIPDAAPRLLKRNAISTRIINHLPFSNLVYNIVRKTRGRTIKNCDISPMEFFACYDTYAKACKKINLNIFIILISKGTTVLKLSPHFNESVDLYNTQLKKVAELNENVILVDGLDGTCLDDYQSDGIHFTAKGQNKIFLNVISALQANKIYFKDANKN